MRSGVIGKKIGMSRYYNELGVSTPVTLVSIAGCQVVAVKKQEEFGYSAVQLAFDDAKLKNVSKPLRGHFAKSKTIAKKKIAEFRVSENALLEPGQEIAADHFVIGQFVDVRGTSIGKGFAGGMKRHGFRGLEATHGVSISHRSHGSTGQRQDPGKVFKGKKMAGHMGDVRVTVQNLRIVDTDIEQGILYISGAIPGAKEGYVFVSDAKKKAMPVNVPFPAAVKSGNDAVGKKQKVQQDDKKDHEVKPSEDAEKAQKQKDENK